MATKFLEGIVLKNNPSIDDTNIITIFSKEFGKISLYALGINKSKSKNKYSLQTFSHSNFEIFKSKSKTKLSKLKTGVLINDSFNLTKNFKNYLFMSGISQIYDSMFELGDINIGAFFLLLNSMNLIKDNKKPFLVYIYCLFHLLKWSGSPWILDKCINCGYKRNSYMRFDHYNDGLICFKCITPSENKQPTSFIQLIIKFNNLNLNQVLLEDFETIDLVALHILIVNFYEEKLGFFVNSFSYQKNKPTLFLSPASISKYL